MTGTPIWGSRLPDLYAHDPDHAWSAGMRRATLSLLHRFPPPPAGPLLELGCGGGAMLSDLAQAFPQRLRIGADINPLAVAHARSLAAGALLYQGDLLRLPFAPGSFAAVLALDVFDQAGVSLRDALAEACRVLAPRGLLVARVSAHPWLQGPHDLEFNTGRRYAKIELRAAALAAGFDVHSLTYANAMLGVAAIPARLLQRYGLLALDNHQATNSGGLGVAVSWILRAEAAFLRARDLPFGLSLYVVAERPDRRA